jgi:hypothetical protein
VKFEVLAAVTVKVAAFWTVTPCAEKPATPFIRIGEYLIMDDAACYFDTSLHTTLHGFTYKKTAVFISCYFLHYS